MGRVYNRITDFNEFLSTSFNFPYQLPPVMKGTASQGYVSPDYYPNFTSDGLSPVFEYSKGPFPGEGSWRFKSLSSYGNTRLRNQASFGSTNSLADLVSSDNYTMGFWLKINSINNTTNTAANVQIQRALTTSGGSTNSQYGITAGTLADPANPTHGAIGFVNTPNGAQIIYTDENNNQIVHNKWYFVALRTTFTGTTRTQKFYINGALKITYENFNFTSGYINAMYWGFVSGGSAFADVNIANWFIAPAADLSEADIQTIWNSSKPMALPLKYYDGTTWQDSTDKKVYYDNQWNPIYANQWDGTNWVQV